MTKKDYVAIAHVFQHWALDASFDWKTNPVWIGLRCELADVMETDNPRFDRGRFYAATEQGE